MKHDVSVVVKSLLDDFALLLFHSDLTLTVQVHISSTHFFPPLSFSLSFNILILHRLMWIVENSNAKSISCSKTWKQDEKADNLRTSTIAFISPALTVFFQFLSMDFYSAFVDLIRRMHLDTCR
eukprot:TRINITY_DN1034_c0_g1_i3.p1 TRINITY_DN1034_c0_g1~~TRINITY_DN1034_c0_g1_i3.p1  ORF type:complete len:124 (-),score=11.75 TRINITY_DN1034_c0_g1_i3:151-522(-)